MVSINVHRIMDRIVSDVIPQSLKTLRTTIPIFPHKFYVSDRHMADRIVDRCFSVETPINNINEMFSRLINKYACELIYLGVSSPNKQIRISVRYKTNTDFDIMLGLNFEYKSYPDITDYFVWKFNTYIPEYRKRENFNYLEFVV